MAARKRRPVLWLVFAALLLGVGAWLMRGAEPPDREKQRPVNLPTGMSTVEQSREAQRRTWLPPPMADAGVVTEPVRMRDPVLALVPAELKRGAVIAEVNAILNSELGPKLTECLFGDLEGTKFLSELRDAGLDPTQAVDRVAMIDDSVVVTGDFKNAQWRKFLPVAPVTKDYGKKGQLHEITREDGGTESFATWGDQMFIAGGEEADLKAVLDRLDGNGPPQGPSALDESMAYGDVYGVVGAQPIADMVRKSDPQLASLIESSAKTMQLHMDVGHDVGMVADVDPSNAATTDQLRRSLGAALSVARMQAAAKGDTRAAELLDLAHVREQNGAGGFRLEAGLPNEFMKTALDECIAQRKQRAEQRRASLPDAGQ
ncbi:MAG: hypothetical protein QM817_23140 [Archangium sp.]